MAPADLTSGCLTDKVCPNELIDLVGSSGWIAYTLPANLVAFDELSPQEWKTGHGQNTRYSTLLYELCTSFVSATSLRRHVYAPRAGTAHLQLELHMINFRLLHSMY